MEPGPLQKTWQDGRSAFGGWVTGPTFAAPTAFVRAGYDYLGIDCQHSYLDEAAAALLVQSLQYAPIATVVRVATLANESIGRLLDAGADAVIVPMISSAQETQAAVAASRYAPRGTRSFGPLRADLGRRTEELEARSSIFVMIETATAVEHVEEICAVPGLGGVYVGPADLALGLGEDQISIPPVARVDAVIGEIGEAARRLGVVAGVHAGSGVAGAGYAKRGFGLITLGAETQLLYQSALADLNAAKS
jgi:4-hydroxy-2-oxoheptanedioate aldolase